MESIIFLIIAGIISAMFNKEKKNPKDKQPTKQMPSFGQQTVPEKSNPVPEKRKPVAKSLEDFANEIFGQLNEKVEQKTNSTTTSVPTESVPVGNNDVANDVRSNRIKFPNLEVRRSERPPLAERPLTQKLKQQEVKFAPTTKQQLVQGIIMAEVLGPPKAKRK